MSDLAKQLYIHVQAERATLPSPNPGPEQENHFNFLEAGRLYSCWSRSQRPIARMILV